MPPDHADPLPAPVSSSPANARQSARLRLSEARERFVTRGGIAVADALAGHLSEVLAQLDPECLGVYWPLRSEFNAARPWPCGESGTALPLALPFAQRNPPAMHYRQWDGLPPADLDECGIATPRGAPVVPDVLLVPCLGYTDDGFRLGYGGGYFDRYLAAHPHVTAVGVAWSVGRLGAGDFTPEAHDQPLMLVVTEQGVVGG